MKPNLTSQQRQAFLALLQARFEKHLQRHPEIPWSEVVARLNDAPDSLTVLHQMEETGGEPDVIGRSESGTITFADCAPESPAGRRSLCYDRAALDSRKQHKPADSAQDMATAIGIRLMTEAEYHHFQSLGPFDQKTSSWLATPAPLRKLGGALFGDFRYGRVFIYHNGAPSYYASRGFRGIIDV